MCDRRVAVALLLFLSLLGLGCATARDSGATAPVTAEPAATTPADTSRPEEQPGY